MLKTKKRSLLVALAFAMVLALSCGAWAATHYAEFEVNGTSNPNASGDITVSGDYYHGLWARSSGGNIVYTGGTIITSGDYASGALANTYGVIQGTGAIVTSGDYAHGLEAVNSGDITWTGSITTNDDRARGVQANNASSVDLTGDIVTYGDLATGFNVGSNSYGTITGNITTHGYSSGGAIASSTGAQLYVEGDISTNGVLAVAISATDNGTVTMMNGTIEIFATDEDTYALGMGNDGTINLQNVTVEEERLLLCGGGTVGRDSSGTLNITEDSVLTGDIVHEGTTADTLKVNLDNSTWSGAAERSGDLGTIDLNLESGTWNVTGDSDTNGAVVADSDSVINYGDAPTGTTVTVDSLEGNPDIDMKPGDKLVIKDGDSVVDIESSSPSVVEVIQNDDGSWEIVSKGEGDAELTYTYKDEDNVEQTVTIGVESSNPVASTTKGTPDLDSIVEGDTVAITYDFDAEKVNGVDGTTGLAGSGLSVAVDADGNVVLSGTAATPGNYYYDVELTLEDGTVVTQRMPVTVGVDPEISGTPADGVIYVDDEVKLIYDFGDSTVLNVGNGGLAGSGLTATVDADGNVVLEGTATTPGNYYYDVTLKNPDGSTMTQKIPVNVGVEPTITGEPADGVITPDTEVDLTYDFGDDYEVVDVDGSGLDGSGLTVEIDENGNVHLSGTATNPGSYYYDVTLIGPDGKPFTQRVPVIVEGGSTPTARGSHSSSGCNAGFGILALLGLALVQRRK